MFSCRIWLKNCFFNRKVYINFVLSYIVSLRSKGCGETIKLLEK